MNEYQDQDTPVILKLLDGIGILFILIGLVDMFGHGNIVPDMFQFDSYEPTLIILGIALIMPSMFHVLKSSLNSNRRNS